MLELMKKYNLLVKRYAKADRYFEDADVTLEAKIEQAENIKNLVNEIAQVGKEIQKGGYIISESEVLGGFRQVEYFEKEGIL